MALSCRLRDQCFTLSPFISVILAYQQKQASWCDSEATKFMIYCKDIIGAESSVQVVVVLIESE